jgi:hypothetical protein
MNHKQHSEFCMKTDLPLIDLPWGPLSWTIRVSSPPSIASDPVSFPAHTLLMSFTIFFSFEPFGRIQIDNSLQKWGGHQKKNQVLCLLTKTIPTEWLSKTKESGEKENGYGKRAFLACLSLFPLPLFSLPSVPREGKKSGDVEAIGKEALHHLFATRWSSALLALGTDDSAWSASKVSHVGESAELGSMAICALLLPLFSFLSSLITTLTKFSIFRTELCFVTKKFLDQIQLRDPIRTSTEWNRGSIVRHRNTLSLRIDRLVESSEGFFRFGHRWSLSISEEWNTRDQVVVRLRVKFLCFHGQLIWVNYKRSLGVFTCLPLATSCNGLQTLEVRGCDG